MLGLCCWVQAFSSWESGGYSSIILHASHFSGFSCCRAQVLGTQALVVVVLRLRCPTTHGIFLDQGSNPCPLHWQADSQPLDQQGGPFPFSWCPFSHPGTQCPQTLQNSSSIISLNLIIRTNELSTAEQEEIPSDQPRWWRRKILNSPPIMDTSKSQLSAKQPTMKKIRTYQNRSSTSKDIKKEPQWDR